MGSGALLDPDAATGPPTGSRRSHPGPEQGSRQRFRGGGSGGSCPGLPPECNQGSLAVPVGVRAAPSAFARRRPARTLQRVRRLVASGSVAASPSWRAIPRRSLSAGAMTKGTRQPPDGAERKVVTVLFADVDETVPQFGERDPEDVGRMLAGHLERARAEIESYGGSVEQVVGGTTIAVFGVPRTREDDPERAVRAALAIRDALLSERARAGPGARRPGWGVPEVRLRIAITTGKALVRAGRVRPGTASRRGGAEPADPGRVTGDLVSMCARIQQAAPPGAILVSDATERVTRRTIAYGGASLLALESRDEPVAVWPAIAPLNAAPTELGQAALGKGRLVAELRQAVAGDLGPVAWRHGRSLPFGDGVTFWALSEVVKAEAGILETD